VLIACVTSVEAHPTGADALWCTTPIVDDAAAAGLPVGAEARDAGDVERLAAAGVALVGIRAGDHDACRAAASDGRTVLVQPADVAAARALVPPERLLVDAPRPVDGAVACCSPDLAGPAAWGEVAAALAAGVRVVRSAEVRSARRVATVLERLRRAREVVAP